MSTIHFIGGEKGGVGKSVMSRLMSQYFLDKGRFYAGLDADQSHGTLTRYYPEFTSPINLDKFESADRIMELALEKDQQVVIDLPAQSQRFLDYWLEENGVLEMCQQSGIGIHYWYVVDDGQDSVFLLEKFLEKYSGVLDCIVVKNFGCGTDFSQIEALPALNTQQYSIKQVFLPSLHAPTLRKVDRSNQSFWSAVNAQGAGGLSLMEGQRVKVWLDRAYKVFDEALPAAVAESQSQEHSPSFEGEYQE